MTHCNGSIHARKTICSSSKAISSHSSITGYKAFFGLCSYPSLIRFVQVPKSQKLDGLTSGKSPGCAARKSLSCPKCLSLSCHWGTLNCLCARKLHQGFRRANRDLSGCNFGITF
jgi:hypothetical protein